MLARTGLPPAGLIQRSGRTIARRIRWPSAAAAPAAPAPDLEFRLPLEADFADPDELADEVWATVVHELAHHLGIDDARLEELGLD